MKLTAAKKTFYDVTLTGFMKDDPHPFWHHLSLDNDVPRDIVVNDELVT